MVNSTMYSSTGLRILQQRRTVPQIFIGNVHVGGFDDLAALDRSEKLDQLLSV